MANALHRLLECLSFCQSPLPRSVISASLQTTKFLENALSIMFTLHYASLKGRQSAYNLYSRYVLQYGVSTDIRFLCLCSRYVPSVIYLVTNQKETAVHT